MSNIYHDWLIDCVERTGEKWGKKENSPEDKKEVDDAREKYIQSLIDDGWSNEDLD